MILKVSSTGAIANCDQFEIANYASGATSGCVCTTCSDGFYSTDAGVSCKHCLCKRLMWVNSQIFHAGDIPNCFKAENTNSAASCTCTQCYSGFYPSGNGCVSCNSSL